MKTIRMSRMWASILGAGALALGPVALSASPGMGWDAFHSGDGEGITSSQMVTPSGYEGQGFDLFHSGDGVTYENFVPAYRGTSLGSEASDGWDVFRVGEGDPLP